MNRIVVFLSVAILLVSSVAHAGVEPSPFKNKDLRDAVLRIADRVEPLIDLPEAAEVYARLLDLADAVKTAPKREVVAGAVEIMDHASVMFNPQPEPPAMGLLESGIGLLDTLSRVAFNPQPEPPAQTFQVFGILDRIASVAFNPQPEPPAPNAVVGMQTAAIGMEILDRIASVAFNPQPEPPAVTAGVIDVFDRIASVAFNPQPEPPAMGAVAAMFDVIDLMSQLALPQ